LPRPEEDEVLTAPTAAEKAPTEVLRLSIAEEAEEVAEDVAEDVATLAACTGKPMQ
jgi:hypothetical protein